MEKSHHQSSRSSSPPVLQARFAVAYQSESQTHFAPSCRWFQYRCSRCRSVDYSPAKISRWNPWVYHVMYNLDTYCVVYWNLEGISNKIINTFICWDFTAVMVSIDGRPLFSARAIGMFSKASANDLMAYWKKHRNNICKQIQTINHWLNTKIKRLQRRLL